MQARALDNQTSLTAKRQSSLPLDQLLNEAHQDFEERIAPHRSRKGFRRHCRCKPSLGTEQILSVLVVQIDVRLQHQTETQSQAIPPSTRESFGPTLLASISRHSEPLYPDTLAPFYVVLWFILPRLGDPQN